LEYLPLELRGNPDDHLTFRVSCTVRRLSPACLPQKRAVCVRERIRASVSGFYWSIEHPCRAAIWSTEHPCRVAIGRARVDWE
jgi:hypothetical protein